MYYEFRKFTINIYFFNLKSHLKVENQLCGSTCLFSVRLIKFTKFWNKIKAVLYMSREKEKTR